MTVKKVTVKITTTGLLILISQGAQISTKPVVVDKAWIDGKDADWLVDFPLGLDVTTEDVGGEGHQFEVVLRKEGDAENQVQLFKGDAVTAELISTEMRNTWMKLNGMDMPVISLSAPALHPAGNVAAGAASFQPVDQGESKPAGWGKKTLLVAAALVAFAGISAGGFLLVNKINNKHAGAPSLDMSGMPLEQIAEMDKRPDVLNSIQDQMLEAASYGRSQAKQFEGTIPDEHLRLLKSMGLDPDATMKSVAACLSK